MLKKSILPLVPLIVLMTILMAVSYGYADSFRCGNRVVSTGDQKIEVIAKCGQPDDIEVVSYDTSGSVSSGGGVALSTKKVENLSYNCGDGRFIRILTFIDGKLVKIKNAGYGSGPVKCE